MKGIVLAGGSGSRLSPLTDVLSKHLLPIYNKPMIYYPISVLQKSGIREILIISTQDHIEMYRDLLNSENFQDVDFSYCIQENPNGLPEAFILGKDFIGSDDVALILGDNLFIGDEVSFEINKISDFTGGVIFGKRVDDPERFGVAFLDEMGGLKRIEEKPKNPESNIAVVGLYVYDSSVVNRSQKLTPSERGELEISDLNNDYLKDGELRLIQLGDSTEWLDTGTFDSLLDAGIMVRRKVHEGHFRI